MARRQLAPLGAKTITEDKLYHVASSAVRDSIQLNGIDHKVGTSGSRSVFSDNVTTYGDIPRIGNYLFRDIDEATEHAKPGVHDIWEVSVPEERKSMYHTDTGLPRGMGAYTPRKISKKYLNLIQLPGPPAPVEEPKTSYS